jgi:hypothetical protein
MALKTPLKLKNTPQPHRAFPPLPVMKPLSSATPKAPTGQVERWLVIHKRTGGVLGVAWDHYWFGARARAEWYYKVPLDALTLRHMPLLQVEKDAQCNMSGEQLVKALGLKMHTEVVVQDVDHAEGTITLGRGCGMTFSFNDESGKYFSCMLPTGHTGDHRAFAGPTCDVVFRWREGSVGGALACRLALGHRGKHHGYKRRWKTGEGLVKR